MKIIITNQNAETVFSFDVETGKAKADIPVNDCAAEFIRGIESAVMFASQFQAGETIRDFLIRAGAGPASGNFVITMGSSGPNGSKGSDVVIHNPDMTTTQKRRCQDCTNGVQVMFLSSGPCTTCNGTLWY
jgi:hypothetical protein